MNYKNDIEGVGTDISPAALKVAKLNAERLGVAIPGAARHDVAGPGAAMSGVAGPGGAMPGAEKADAGWHDKAPIFVESDLFEGLAEQLSMSRDSGAQQFDLIVSNPPYIRSDVIETLEPEVKDHEPRCALDGGSDGLVFYRRIIVDAPAFLRQGGRLMLEIGYDQGEAVSSLMEASGFSEVKVVKDLAGLDRVVKAKYR